MDEFAGLKKKSKRKVAAPVTDVALPGAEELEAKEKAAAAEQAAASAPAPAPVATSSKPEDDAVRPLEANADLTGSANVLDDFADLKVSSPSLRSPSRSGSSPDRKRRRRRPSPWIWRTSNPRPARPPTRPLPNSPMTSPTW
jgi:PleD family two-component response regulator